MPHRVTLTGSPRTLAWPPLCAACGGVATTPLPVTRVFARDWRFSRASRSRDDFRILALLTLEVPFCPACTARHVSEARPVRALRATVSVFTTPFVLPLVVALLACVLYVAPALLGPAGALVAVPQRPSQAAGFALAAVLFAAVVWHQTRHTRVSAPTAITRSFDFSDNLGSRFGVERRVYGMENVRFAEAFTTANASRVWDPAQRPSR